MSGLEALGVACNIFQVISFGHETISLCKRVYQDGSPCPELNSNAVQLNNFSAQIQKFSVPDIPTKEDQQLQEVASKCRKISADLTEEIGFINSHGTKGSWKATLKVAAKTNWRKRRLDTLEKKLGDVQKLMETGLLVRICNKSDALSLGLDTLDQNLQSFVKQYQDGHRTASKLISKEALSTRDHVTSEVEKSEKSIKQHISCQMDRSEDAMSRRLAEVAKSTSSKLSNEMKAQQSEGRESTQRDRILNSLKFAGFNERRNQVVDAYGSTFQWIFEQESSAHRVEVSNDGVSVEQIEKRWSNFSSWLKSDEPVYWISGKPGSGKTTLLNYLLSQPKTQNLLSSWKPDVVIISHFFWRPGSAMQRNVKGFFCSLLYQLLLANTSTIDMILEQEHEVALKDSDTDWSIRELRRVFFQVLQQYNRPICLFIDGIDEIDTQEGVQDFLGLFEELTLVSNLKMCVTSRPEQPIYDYLHPYPQLQIHDLTLKDLQLYAISKLRVPSDHLEVMELLIIIGALITKADGVFLWLCLAVNSVNRGISNGDDAKTLIERINSLPADLLDMYKDMWARLNDDQGIYRKKAAQYFNLLIAAGKVVPKELGESAPHSFMSSNMSILEMRLASILPDDDFFSFKTAPSVGTLLKQCQNTEKSLRICCAGFLEIVDGSLTAEDEENTQFQQKSFQPVRPYLTGERSIAFLHRTAYDFMVDTAEGRAILACDDTPTEIHQLRLLKASLAVRQVCMLGGMRWVCNAQEFARQGTFCTSLELILSDLSFLNDHIEINGPSELYKSQSYHLINLIERMYNIVRPFSENWRRLTGEFLIRAAAFNLGDWVPDRLVERQSTEFLKSLLLMGASSIQFMHRSPAMFKLTQKLLKLGCDPNVQSASFCNIRYMSLLETPLCHFLRANMVYWVSNRKGFMQAYSEFERFIDQVPETLDAYIAHGADVKRKVLLAFQLKSDGSFIHRYPLEVWHDSDPGRYIVLETPASFIDKAIRRRIELWKSRSVGLDKEEDGARRDIDPAHIIDCKDIVDDSVVPVSRVIAVMDESCKIGAYYKVSKKDSRYLAAAVEMHLSSGRQDGMVMMAIRHRHQVVCKRSERSKEGKRLENLLVQIGHAIRQNM